jgi:Cu+-exporting ATPase
LSSLTPTPSSVDVSLPLQSVAVHHPPGLSQDAIECAVYDAGFDVVQDSFDDTESIDSSQHSFISGASTILAGRRWLHIEQCALCKGEQRRNSYLTKDGHDSLPLLLVYEKAPGPRHDSYLSVRDRPSSLIPLPLVIEKPPSVHLQVHSPEKFYVSLFPTPTSKHSSFKQGPFRVTIAVGGMTCSSCTTAINNMVSELSGVSEVIVNLLDRSAIVIVEREDLAEIVAETIIDCGFEAQIVTVELVNAAPMDHQAQSLRTLSLRIDGMFSPYAALLSC